MELPRANCRLAEKCKAVLSQSDGGVDFKNQEYMLMCLSIDDMDFTVAFKHEEEPGPVKEYTDFTPAKETEKRAILTNNPTFFTTGAVGAWLKKLSAIRSGNNSKRCWLMDCLKVMNDRAEHARARRVSMMLASFPTDNQQINDDEDVIGIIKSFGGGSVVKPGKRIFGYDD